MEFKLEKPKNSEDVKDQVESIFKLIFDTDEIVSPASPITFMRWWRDGLVKVFTAKHLGSVEAVRVYMVLTDALDAAKHHVILSISVGESKGLDNYAANVLDAFR